MAECLFPGCVLPRGHKTPFHEPPNVPPLTLRNLIARLRAALSSKEPTDDR